MQRSFKVVLEWDAEGNAYHASVPALPGCVSFGASKNEAMERIQEAIEGYLEALKDTGQTIPLPDIEIVEVQINYA